MSIKKFTLVTTALMGLYGASASFNVYEESMDKPTRSERIGQKQIYNCAQNLANEINQLEADFKKSAVMVSDDFLLAEVTKNGKNIYYGRTFGQLATSEEILKNKETFVRSSFAMNTYPYQLNKYQLKLNNYNNSWKGFFNNSISSAAKAFGGLFY